MFLHPKIPLFTGENSAVQKINQTSGSNISNKNHYLNIGRLTIYKRGIEYYGNL